MENGFIKQTRFSLVNSDGDIFVSNISINDEFVKKAENDFKYDKAIIDYIDTKLKPVKGKSYLLINAMGASDYFGSNMNADWFSEPVLEDFHKTFESYGRAYRHHVNKDESIAEGKVIFSSYNKKMHRVELIVEVDDSKVKDILEKLDQKEIPATSMACKVSHDICSICGNKAKSRKDYCMHLKYFKNKIHSPSTPIPGAKQYGQKVYAINPDPKFFDISFVKIPADATSSVITKLAKAFGKESVIKKEIIEPMKDSDPNIKVIPSELIDAAHGSLTKEEMRKLLEKYSSADIMTHMVLMNMIPSRKDFQYMHLVDNNLEKYAEILYDSNIVFDCTDVEPDTTIPGIIERTKFNPELGNELSKFGERIGMGEPLVVARILTTDFEKSAEPKDTTINTVPYFLGVGGAYYGYNKYLDAKAKSGWGDFSKAFGFKEKLPPAAKHKGATWLMRQHPLLLASGLVGAGILSNYAQKGLKDVKTMLEKTSAAPDSEYFKKIMQKPGLGHFLTATAIASPLAFLYSSHNRDKMSKGEEVSALGAFAARHPYIAALGGIGATYIPKKIMTAWDKGTFGRDKVRMVKTSSASDYISYIYHYDTGEYEKIYSDLINY